MHLQLGIGSSLLQQWANDVLLHHTETNYEYSLTEFQSCKQLTLRDIIGGSGREQQINVDLQLRFPQQYANACLTHMVTKRNLTYGPILP